MSSLLDLLSAGQVDLLIEHLSQLPSYSIGRRADNAIVISNPKISGQHAQLIQCTKNSFVLEDLDSKNGTFVDDVRITRKVVDRDNKIKLADSIYTIDQLLDQVNSTTSSPIASAALQEPLVEKPVLASVKPQLDFTHEFAELQSVYKQYPKLRRDCRNRERMIRTGSVILSSIIGVSASVATGGAALPLLHIISGAGLGMLIPTLCSTILSTEEKLEIIDKEYRERYRCPNPACRDPFGTREWDLLAQQKTCRRCQAIWVE